MTLYTAQVQIRDPDGDGWEEAAPAGRLDFAGGIEDAAAHVAATQTLVDGPWWRVRVWYGGDADTSTPAPAAVYPHALLHVS